MAAIRIDYKKAIGQLLLYDPRVDRRHHVVVLESCESALVIDVLKP